MSALKVPTLSAFSYTCKKIWNFVCFGKTRALIDTLTSLRAIHGLTTSCAWFTCFVFGRGFESSNFTWNAWIISGNVSFASWRMAGITDTDSWPRAASFQGCIVTGTFIEAIQIDVGTQGQCSSVTAVTINSIWIGCRYCVLIHTTISAGSSVHIVATSIDTTHAAFWRFSYLNCGTWNAWATGNIRIACTGLTSLTFCSFQASVCVTSTVICSKTFVACHTWFYQTIACNHFSNSIFPF